MYVSSCAEQTQLNIVKARDQDLCDKLGISEQDCSVFSRLFNLVIGFTFKGNHLNCSWGSWSSWPAVARTPSSLKNCRDWSPFRLQFFIEGDCEHKECLLSPLQSVPPCFMSLFFILIYLLLLHFVPFHQNLSIPSVHAESKDVSSCATLDQEELTGMTFWTAIFLLENKIILLSGRGPSCRWSLVLLQGLVGTYSVWLPLGMMSFQFGCGKCMRKGKKETQLAKTGQRNANWLTAMKSIRGKVGERVLLLISSTSLGRVERRLQPRWEIIPQNLLLL